MQAKFIVLEYFDMTLSTLHNNTPSVKVSTKGTERNYTLFSSFLVGTVDGTHPAPVI